MGELTLQQAFESALRHHQAGRLHEAEVLYRQILAQQPEDFASMHLLGVIAYQAGHYDSALDLIRRAIAINPNVPEAHSNLGNVLRDIGQLTDAIAAYRQAVALNANYAEAHYNLALGLLLHGYWEEGWLEHEWRWKASGMQSPRPFTQPLWNGQDPEGKTILVHGEQGFGDAIQFLRYVPLLASRGAKIVLALPSELNRIARPLSGVSCVLEPGRPLPPFDLHCPILSLPAAFKTTPRTIPAQVPYLFPDPELVELWRHKPALAAPGIKVGLVWAGNPGHKNDRNRSIPLSILAPLANVAGLHFHSLQKGPPAAAAANPPPGMPIHSWADDLGDFADATTLIAHLDLVISVDTAIAHLAGAMAKPVWLLLPFVPDWRWLLHRQDSPWYPNMRLFRQSTLGDWPGVIARVAAALTALADAQRPSAI